MAICGAESSCNCLLVAAFDFGTTYSGYAFSFRDDPNKIQTNQGWNAGSEKLISLKTPTCVLIRPDKQFDSFGFDAENKYSELAEENQHLKWMLFRRFKMFLHNNKGLTRSSTVEDITGQTMPAMEIFSMAIKFLQKHLLKTLNNQILGILEENIQYVITVPAIWNDHAKQFMREAAVEAGIDSARLRLSLEPEAASIWCQLVPTQFKETLSGIGCQYMVVDLGGGTVDISVHEKKGDGSLKEIHKASGGPWGGIVVDNNHIRWLTQLFGEDVMQRFKTEQMADFFDVQREFEIKKRTIKADTKGKITLRVSASLREIYQEVKGTDLKQRVQEMGLAEKVVITSDKLRIDVTVVRSWFESPINKTITHMKNLLSEDKMKAVKQILIVGGFGECELVQEKIRSQFQNKTVIVPNEAGLAVLKGAVRFGHLPQLVSSRVMKYTYGVGVVRENVQISQSCPDSDDDSLLDSDVSEHSNNNVAYTGAYFDEQIFVDNESYSDKHSDSDVSEYSNSGLATTVTPFEEQSFFDIDSHSDEQSEYDSVSSAENSSIVDDVFDKFVTVGEEIPVGYEVERSYIPMNPRCVEIPVYCTRNPNPELVTDRGCEKLGVLTIEFPDGETCEDNKNEVALIFGDTELTVKAKVLRTGQEFFTRINCLR